MDGAEKPCGIGCPSSTCLGEIGEKFHTFYKKEKVELLPLKIILRTAKMQLSGLQLLFETSLYILNLSRITQIKTRT